MAQSCNGEVAGGEALRWLPLAASKVATQGAAQRESVEPSRRPLHLLAACPAPAALARLSRCPCRCPAGFAPASSLDTSAFPAPFLVCPPQHFDSCAGNHHFDAFIDVNYLPGLCPEKLSVSAGKFPRLGLQPVVGFLGRCNLDESFFGNFFNTICRPNFVSLFGLLKASGQKPTPKKKAIYAMQRRFEAKVNA